MTIINTSRKKLPILVLALLFAATLLSGSVNAAGPFPNTPVAGHLTTNGSVSSIMIADDGSEYIGGSFSEIGGVTRNNLARILPDGTIDPDFDADISSQYAGVNDILIDSSTNTLYVGGSFSTVNGSISRNNLAAFDAITGVVKSFDPNVSHDTLPDYDSVMSLALSPGTNTLYVGGYFTTVNGFTPRNGAAAFDITTSVATSFAPELFYYGLDPYFRDIVISPDGQTLYAGGYFSTIDGSTSRNGLAAFSISTGLVTDFNPSSDPQIQEMVISADGKRLYVASYGYVGEYDTSSGATNRTIAVNSGAFALALDEESDMIYIGGDFYQVDGEPRTHLAAFNITTGLVASFAPNINDRVLAVDLDPNSNTLYAGGVFSEIDNQPQPGFVAFQGPPRQTIANAETNESIQLQTPLNTNITCTSASRETSLSVQDSYTYPLGLVRFCFDTPENDNEVTLTFATDLEPNELTVRKYNSTTNSYYTIDEATVVRTTYHGSPALRVTYTITDNGPLDLNPNVGEIEDPVGLAAVSSQSNNDVPNNMNAGTLASTGQNLYVMYGSVGLLFLSALLTRRYSKYLVK